jgi:hypothetical protein
MAGEPDATLSQLLSGRAGNEVLGRLVDDGVVTMQETAKLASAKGLTKEGMAKISQLMLGRFFRDPAQLTNIPQIIRNKLERVAAPLARLEGSEWSLTDHVQSAMDLIEEARVRGKGNIDDLLKQSGLFGQQMFPPEAVVLARALQKTTQRSFVEALSKYSEDASFAIGGNALFGNPPIPGKSFAEWIEPLATASKASKKAGLKKGLPPPPADLLPPPQ